MKGLWLLGFGALIGVAMMFIASIKPDPPLPEQEEIRVIVEPVSKEEKSKQGSLVSKGGSSVSETKKEGTTGSTSSQKSVSRSAKSSSGSGAGADGGGEGREASGFSPAALAALKAMPRNDLSKQETVVCPLDIEKPNVAEGDCGNLVFLKLLGEKNTEQEMEGINEIFEKLHHDNVSNPEFLVDRTVRHLRIHHQCLQDICREVFFKCAIETPELENNQVYEEYGWCRQRASKIIELQKAKLAYVAMNNQARKERTLLEEKFHELRERFMNHIHERMNNLLVQLKRFERKVNKLIKYPKRRE